MTVSLVDVAALLPDIPQWVEVRSMLLHGQAKLIGSVSSAPPTFVVLHEDGDQAVVVGRAAREAILDAGEAADEILVATVDTAWVSAILPEWRVESADLFHLAAPSRLPKITSTQVRFLAAGELATSTTRLHPPVPAALRDELRWAERTHTPVAVALDEGRPAAFCYAGSITETLWDVSIDTLEPYRRRGHAARAVAFLIEHYRTQGKGPVWGAMVSNHASAALAARLGFAPVGSLSVFTAPRVVDP